MQEGNCSNAGRECRKGVAEMQKRNCRNQKCINSKCSCRNAGMQLQKCIHAALQKCRNEDKRIAEI
jgi:hypothetical protein